MLIIQFLLVVWCWCWARSGPWYRRSAWAAAGGSSARRRPRRFAA